MKLVGSVLVLILMLSVVSFAQIAGDKMQLAERNNVFCAGYIQTSPINTSFSVVGADNESDQFVYSEGQMVYVNRGANSGVKAGDVYSVVRPRGQFKSKFSKKGKLGFYVEEVGSVEIVKVKDSVSVAQVKTSCGEFLLGDLLQPMESRIAPEFTQRPELDLFSESSGKAAGRIIMARDHREHLSRDQIVYIDLGAEDNVKTGDYLTIFRPLGKTKIVKMDENEDIRPRDSDYASDTFTGSNFSITSPRIDGNTAEGAKVTTPKAKKSRPNNLRKVVGEMVILRVKERTATAIIVRNAQEIHPGDMVELQ